MFEIENDKAYRINSISNRIDFLYFEEAKVYLKERKFFTDIKYSISENKIYKGSSNSTFDLLYTIKNNKVYLGSGTFQSDCLFTFKDGVIYRGDSESSFDAFMAYENAKSEDLIYIICLILPY